MDGWMSGVLSPCSLGSRTTDLPHISNVTYVCVCVVVVYGVCGAFVCFGFVFPSLSTSRSSRV